MWNANSLIRYLNTIAESTSNVDNRYTANVMNK